MKTSKMYVIEYRYFDKESNTWIHHISQEGYSTYEAARDYCKARTNNEGVTAIPFYFQGISATGLFEEYYIHEISVK